MTIKLEKLTVLDAMRNDATVSRIVIASDGKKFDINVGTFHGTDMDENVVATVLSKVIAAQGKLEERKKSEIEGWSVAEAYWLLEPNEGNE